MGREGRLQLAGRGLETLLTKYEEANQDFDAGCLRSGMLEVVSHIASYFHFQLLDLITIVLKTRRHLSYIHLSADISNQASKEPNNLHPQPHLSYHISHHLNRYTNRVPTPVKAMSGRPERPSKKLRTLSTDSEGGEEAYDWVGLKGSSQTQARGGRAEVMSGKKSE